MSIIGSTVVDGFRGYWFQPLSGASSGEIRNISALSSGGYFSYLRNITSGLSTSATYELWDEDMPPARIDDFITRAVLDAGIRAYTPVTDLSVHATPQIASYALSTAVAGIYRVEYRDSYTGKSVQTCDTVWDDQLLANVTRVADGEQYREGSGSNHLTVAAAASSGILSGASIATALNLSRYTHLEAWFRANVGTSGSDLVVPIATITVLTSPTDSMAVPALSSGVWTYVRMAMASAAASSAIAAIGVRAANDIGAYELWVDGIQATVQGSESWKLVHPDCWRLDQDRRELVLNETARSQVGYALLKVSTMQRPALPTVNGSTIVLDAEYVTYRATAMALRARGDRRAETRKSDYQQADLYDGLADRRRTRMHVPDGVRWLANA